MKVLFSMPLRQTTGFVESLLRLAGLDWKVPDFSTLCRRQKALNVAIPYRGGKGPLHLLIDATGIKAEGEGEWNARKHGGPKKRIWRKLHLGMDEETLEIRAVGVTTSNVGDAPMLPDLLDQIPPNEESSTVTADGAYDTRRCHNVIAARGASAARHCARTNGASMALSRHARMLNSGSQPQRAPLRETKLSGLANISGGLSGESSPDITAEAALKRKYTASNSLAKASWRETSTVRWLSSKSGSPCSIAILLLAYPSQSP